MRYLRFLVVVIAVLSILALATYAFVGPAPLVVPGDDDIIIKGGSLDVDCGKNHGDDCFGGNDNHNKPKHQKPGKIVKIVVMKSNGTVLRTFTKKRNFPDGKPIVIITYREPKPEDN